MTEQLGNRILFVLLLGELITHRFETLCLDKHILIEPDYFLPWQKHSNISVLVQMLYNSLVGTNGFNEVRELQVANVMKGRLQSVNFPILHSGYKYQPILTH